MKLNRINAVRKLYKKQSLNKVRKFSKDVADGTLVFILIAMPFLVLVMTSIITISQTTADKNELNDFVQRSAQAGVAKVNAYGSLNKQSMLAVAKNFYLEEQRAEGVHLNPNESSYYKKMIEDGYGDHISTKFCTADIRRVDSAVDQPKEKRPLLQKNSPYYLEITLSDSRGIGNSKGDAKKYGGEGISKTIGIPGPITPASLNTASAKIGNLGLNPNDTLQVIQVKAYVNMRSAWTYPGQDPCKTFVVDVSATTFGSREDVDYNNDYKSRNYLGPIQKNDWNRGR